MSFHFVVGHEVYPLLWFFLGGQFKKKKDITKDTSATLKMRKVYFPNVVIRIRRYNQPRSQGLSSSRPVKRDGAGG